MIVHTDDYLFVDFGAYCAKCKHKDKADTESPCDDCLSNPTNLHTRVPIKFEKK